MEICAKKNTLKKKLINYYSYLNYLVKSITSKNLNNYLVQKGGVLPVVAIVFIVIWVIIMAIGLLFQISGIRYFWRKASGGGDNKINNFEVLFEKNKLTIVEEMCVPEKINKLLCYKNYLNNEIFNESMTDIKNFLIVNIFIIVFLNNLFEIISVQGEELVSIKDKLNNNFFYNIINYKIVYLGKNEVKKKMIYYKFSLINKKTDNVYNFELTFNQIKKIFSLKSFSKIKYFVNDTFFNFIYNIIKNVKTDIINNRSSFLNYLFKSRRNKKISNNINDVSLMYKLLKRISSNLFLKMSNNLNNMKLSKYYDNQTLLKNGNIEFINNFVDDLCNQKNIEITIIDGDFNKIDKRIEKLQSNELKNN